jgi:hypothetical protein
MLTVRLGETQPLSLLRFKPSQCPLLSHRVNLAGAWSKGAIQLSDVLASALNILIRKIV